MKLLHKKWFSKKGKIHLEFCQNNLDKFLDEESFPVFQAFFNEEKVWMKEYKCLSQCEICSEKPYAKVNGVIVEADHPQDLIHKLRSIKNGA
jgi:uncharacterized protein YuzB (UPF0349 family)